MNWTLLLMFALTFFVTACTGEEPVVDMSKVDCHWVRTDSGDTELKCR